MHATDDLRDLRGVGVDEERDGLQEWRQRIANFDRALHRQVARAWRIEDQPDRIGAAITMIDRSLMLMQCGLLMLLIIFEKRLKISWRSYAASITLGVGVTAAVSLLTSVMATSESSYNQTLFLAYQVITVGFFAYWGIMLQRPEPQRKNVLDSPSRLIFQRWNEVLSSTPLAAHGAQLAMAEVDSFIPGVEKTVERIMARKMTIN